MSDTEWTPEYLYPNVPELPFIFGAEWEAKADLCRAIGEALRNGDSVIIGQAHNIKTNIPSFDIKVGDEYYRLEYREPYLSFNLHQAFQYCHYEMPVWLQQWWQAMKESDWNPFKSYISPDYATYNAESERRWKFHREAMVGSGRVESADEL